jgi:hypothetical protein
MMKMENEKIIKVSDECKNIYKNLNVLNQVDEIKKLSKRELYLLLMLGLDKFSEDDPVVKFNLSSFSQELLEIFDVQDDKEVNSDILKSLIDETGDRYIETDYIVDIDGNKLPEPLSKDEVRDAKINLIKD